MGLLSESTCARQNIRCLVPLRSVRAPNEVPASANRTALILEALEVIVRSVRRSLYDVVAVRNALIRFFGIASWDPLSVIAYLRGVADRAVGQPAHPDVRASVRDGVICIMALVGALTVNDVRRVFTD